MTRIPLNPSISAVALAAVLTVTATASFAHSDGHRGKGFGAKAEFSELDADGSGEVTLAEMQAHRAARLADMDTNNDGALSKEELIAAREGEISNRMERRLDRMIDRLDENDDGLLQFAEMPQADGGRAEERFAKVDTDGSGGLSEAEMEAAKGKRGGKKGDKKRDKKERDQDQDNG